MPKMAKIINVLVILSTLTTIVIGQHDYTTPVPILKQINKHNEDGSYSYGYEGADGSFKIETKYPNGEVYGKYGYVDDSGKLREVEYGASRRGFEPQGNDINVPPPTLTNNNPNLTPLGSNEEDDGQYREDPRVYYKDQKGLNNNNDRQQIPVSNFRLDKLSSLQSQNNQPENRFNYKSAPVYQAPEQSPPYNAPPVYQAPQQTYNPPSQAPAPRRYQTPHNEAGGYNNPNTPQFHHPALQNIDIYSGSYSVSYTGR